MDAKIIAPVRGGTHRLAVHLKRLHKQRPILFFVVMGIGVTLLVLAFAAGSGELVKAIWGVGLERLLGWAFLPEKAEAAGTVASVVAGTVE